MTKQRLFITGASGCIGHYVVEQLLKQTEHELIVLVRNPDKLKVTVPVGDRLQILQGNLREINRYEAVLKTVDTAILLAAAWGGWEETYDVNVSKTIQILRILGTGSCQKVLYFSTESVLDQHNQPLREALEIGTDYIRTKAIALQQIERLKTIPPLVALFPTLVFGGDQTKPMSHVSSGLPEFLSWLWLAKCLSIDASFHFMHAYDIAQIVVYLVDNPVPAIYKTDNGWPKIVLGQDAIFFNQALRELCQYFQQRIYFKIPLRLWLANLLIRLLRIQVATWDRFCLQYRHFVHQHPLNPHSLGLPPHAATLADLLQVSGIPQPRSEAQSS